MKLIKSGLTAVATISLAVGAVFASMPVASASAASASEAWVYQHANYSGEANKLEVNGGSGWAPTHWPVQSVINKSGRNMCGRSTVDRTRTYTFWSGGSWNVIGAPFDASHPLNEVKFC